MLIIYVLSFSGMLETLQLKIQLMNTVGFIFNTIFITDEKLVYNVADAHIKPDSYAYPV